jgi:hypothetical protein
VILIIRQLKFPLKQRKDILAARHQAVGGSLQDAEQSIAAFGGNMEELECANLQKHGKAVQ